MQITVTIPDELAAQVQARGLVLETYVGELVRQAEAERKRQAVEAVLEFAGSEGKRQRKRSVSQAVEQIAQLRQGNRLDGLRIKDLIEEGRKY